MALPELCTTCRKLKTVDVMDRVRVPGRMHDRRWICHACTERRAHSFEKDRTHKESPLEQRARVVLHEAGYVFRQEHKVGPFYFDFAVPALRVLIEVDGHRWHAHRAGRDAAKERLALREGWKVVRLRSQGLETGVRAAIHTAEQELLDGYDETT